MDIQAIRADYLSTGLTASIVGINVFAALFTIVTVLPKARPAQDLTTKNASYHLFGGANVVRTAICALGGYPFRLRVFHRSRGSPPCRRIPLFSAFVAGKRAAQERRACRKAITVDFSSRSE
jgi:hypothetical protein